jgi:hypothetical protein
MKRILFSIAVLALVVVAYSLPALASESRSPDLAPPLQPQATAEAAGQRAEQLAATLQAAHATEAAAWGQATAQAAQATAGAEATASVVARQATATAAAATAAQWAFEGQLTRQAADVEATRAVYALAVTATAMANAQRAEALAVERARVWQPLALYGPWALFFLLIGVVVWGARRLVPAVETYLVNNQVIEDEGPVIARRPGNRIGPADVVAPGRVFEGQVVDDDGPEFVLFDAPLERPGVYEQFGMVGVTYERRDD